MALLAFFRGVLEPRYALADAVRSGHVSGAAIDVFAEEPCTDSPLFALDQVVVTPHLGASTREAQDKAGDTIADQVLLALAILALGRSDPAVDLGATVFWAVVVAFLSASQDIVIDAYRVEILEERQQGAGAAAVTVGYRVAMLASGAGALVLADQYGWLAAYAVMAALLAVGAVAVLLAGEPAGSAAAVAGTRRDLAGWLRQAVVEPFADFFARNGLSPADAALVMTRGQGYLRMTTDLPPSYRRLRAGMAAKNRKRRNRIYQR